MRFILCSLLGLFLFSCQSFEAAVGTVLSSKTVKVTVDSEKTGENVSRQGTLSFPSSSDSKEMFHARKQCMRGAEFAGLKADGRCQTDCKFVVIDSSIRTSEDGLIKRSLQLSVFSDKELKNKIYLAKVEAVGERDDVLVELCDAAFQAFPETLNGQTFNIHVREP